MPVRFFVNRIADTQYIVNRSAFQCRSASNLKKPVFIFKALLAITFRDVQWNRLRSTKPLIASMSIYTAERPCDPIREGSVLNR